MSALHLGRRSIVTATLAAPALLGARARAAGNIQMISHRYPALEYYAEKMRTAIPGTTVNTQLMPFDKALELCTIAFSSKAETPDIVYANDSTSLTFAKNGWLRPLDELWAKYKDEFNLGEIPESVLRAYRRNGKLYLMPFTLNTMLFFYRKDLFDAAGKQPPTTIAEYRDLAKSFNSPMRSGTISCAKPVDAGLNEAHWYINTIGDGWFDADWHPVFNDAKGVQAIETMKEIVQYAQQGFTAAANDECTIALQQDTAAMGLQWATRAKAMDDPAKSRVVGKIEWVAPPQGHARIGSDGYAISAFSKQDPDTLFRILATATRQENMRGAASLALPPRYSVLKDADLKAANRFYPASLAAVETGLAFPALPEFYAVGEFITRRVLQAVTGEMPVKDALNAAATETTDFLKGHGYYR
jgi:multiple sugar transport system substrate-binding protein